MVTHAKAKGRFKVVRQGPAGTGIDARWSDEHAVSYYRWEWLADIAAYRLTAMCRRTTGVHFTVRPVTA